MKFPDAQILCILKISSNYCPILARFARSTTRVWVPIPFCFLAAWLMDNRFPMFISNNWVNDRDYMHLASIFVRKVNICNEEVFENIQRRKNKILARLWGIQRALELYSFRYLIKLDISLQKKLEITLSHEELL